MNEVFFFSEPDEYFCEENTLEKHPLYCRHCWEKADQGRTHCSDCGSLLELLCPQCGAVVASSMVCCLCCGLELSHIPVAPSLTDKIMPSVAELRHPLEVSRFKAVLAVDDISFLVHRARSFGESTSLPLKSLEGLFDAAMKAVIPGVCLSFVLDSRLFNYGYGPVHLGGSPENPIVFLGRPCSGIMASDEITYAVSVAAFSLYCGLYPYLLLAQAAFGDTLKVHDEVRTVLVKWYESFWYSADRFGAVLFRRPSLWLRTLVKISAVEGDDVGKLIDSGLRDFPDNPSKVASVMRAHSGLVRRLVELSDFVKSHLFQEVSSSIIKDAAALFSESLPVHAHGPEECSSKKCVSSVGSSLEVLQQCQFRDSSEPQRTCVEQGNVMSEHGVFPDPSQSRSEIAERTASGKKSSLIYLSSFRNEMTMFHGDLTVFKALKLHGYCRHPRSIAVAENCSCFFVADFELSSIFGFSYRGDLLVNPGRQAGLSHPSGMTVDGSGNLWVADCWNNRLVSFSSTAGYSEHVECLSGDCHRPLDMTYDRQRDGFWVCDSGNRRILRLSEDGEILFSFGEKYLSVPQLVRVDFRGNILVSDSMTGTIHLFEPTGSHLGFLDPLDNGGKGIFIDSMDTGLSDELILSPRGANHLLWSTNGGRTFENVLLPVEKSNEWGFPSSILIKSDLVNKVSSSLDYSHSLKTTSTG